MLRCSDCGATLVAHGEDLGRHQMTALLAHDCEERAAKAKRIRRHREPGWWAGSYSSISNYDSCPRQYKFEIDSTTREQGPEAVLGNAVHREAQRRGDGLPSDNGDVPIDRWFEFEQLKEQVQNHKLPPGLQRFEAVWLIEWWIRPGLRAQIRTKADVVCIDWANRVAYIIDWKTGKYNNDMVRRKWAMQRLIYALGAFRNIPYIDRVVAWTLHLPTGSILPYDGDVTTAGRAEVFASYLADKVQTISNDTEYRPNTGQHCRLCRWANKCDAAQEALGKYELELKIVGQDKKQVIVIPESLSADPDFQKALEAANFQLGKLLNDAKKVLKLRQSQDDEEDDAA